MSNRAILKLALLVGLVVAGWVLLTTEAPEDPSRRSRWSPQEAAAQATEALISTRGEASQWRTLGQALASYESPLEAADSWIASHGSIAPWAEAYTWYWTGWGLWRLTARDLAITAFESAAPAFETLRSSGAARPIDLYRRARTLYELDRSEAATAALEETVEVLLAESSSPGERFTQAAGMSVSLWVSLDRPLRAAETLGALAPGLTVAPVDSESPSVGELLQRLVRSARNPDLRDASVSALEAFDSAAATSSDHARMGRTWRRLSMSDRADASWRAALEAHRRAGAADASLRSHRVWLYNLACYAALCGEREAALDAWEGAVAAGWTDWRHASLDDDLASVRDSARFAAQFPADQRRIYLSGAVD